MRRLCGELCVLLGLVVSGVISVDPEWVMGLCLLSGVFALRGGSS